ncbi:MAG: twin-arginine translocation signal domain-containing protein [Acidimicrobiales bacterium]
MENLSRRNFLKRGSVAVAGAGLIAAVPMTTLLPEVMGSGEAAAPAAEAATADVGEAGSVGETLVAHVRSLGSGEISVMQGERAVVIKDPQMAAKLARAMR